MAENIKCKTCGADVPADMKFCASCGAAVERAQAPEVSKKEEGFAENKGSKNNSFKFVKVLVSIAVVIAVLGVALVSYVFLKSEKYGKVKNMLYITNNTEKNAVVIHQDGKSKSSVDGRYVDLQYNFDETKAAFLVSEKGNWSLYYVTDEVQLIDEDVSRFSFSASGNAVAYAKKNNSSEADYELWLYSDNKHSLINEKTDGRMFVSPNGSAISYVAYDGDNKIGCVWDGKEHELGKDIIPVAVSDGAKYIYYEKDVVLYVQKGIESDERERLALFIGSFHGYLIVNKDLSQAIFYDSDRSKSYISRDGGKKESLSDERINKVITPNGTKSLHRFQNGMVDIYPISSFSDTYYKTLDYVSYFVKIYHITKQYKAIDIADDNDTTSEVFLANDGKTLIYLQSGRIYKVNGMEENPNTEVLVSEDANQLFAVSDGSAVFFTNEDNELYYQKGKSKPKLVSSDEPIDEYDPRSIRFAVFKGDSLYYAVDNELYFSSGAKGKLVNEFDYNIYSINVEGGAVIVSTYTVDNGYNSNSNIIYSAESLSLYKYRSIDGRNFELIEED
ncbi:MAG: zinc ribbon domain-containing protein [Clostridiales bacterium]|jgi:hypothetical protein|nr:zinc ribbon domain-containing protein [Clostridiales bacterium]